MCALSADAEVMREIMAEFTGETDGQRARRGTATALLALDRRSDRAGLRTVPGLVLAEPRLEAWPQGSMLHAKVALLGYARDAAAPIERLRLIVSTGNWTSCSLNKQIEMLRADEIDLVTTNNDQVHADIKAAAEFLNSLLFGAPAGNHLFQTTPAAVRNAELIKLGTLLRSRRRPRFIHSLEKPLFGQIMDRFEPASMPWNWLYAGSGFFEQATASEPVVLPKIAKSLAGRMTKTRRQGVLLNPEMAGFFAGNCLGGWTHYRPKRQQCERSLHAKFLAAGREHADRYLDVTVYLGSGNLTIPGLMSAFANQASQTRIEAGMVFGAGNIDSDDLWDRLLPDGDEIAENEVIAAGEGDSGYETEAISPPPILFAVIVEAAADAPRRLQLCKAQPESPAQMRLGQAVVDVGLGVTDIPTSNFRGAYLEVRASPNRAWEVVPVIGPDGDFARVTPIPGDVEDALDLLLAFPGQTEAEDEKAEEPDYGRNGPPVASTAGDAPGRYPARDAMRIVEAVARSATNGGMHDPSRLQALIRTIRHALKEGLKLEEKRRLAGVQVNFFAALLDMPDMPKAVEWDSLICDLAQDWGLEGLPAFPRVNGRGTGGV